MVLFNAIPGNLRVPFFYAEVNSGGSPYQGQSKLLLIGQRVTGQGTAVNDVPFGPVQSEQQVIGLAGLGSMLVDMYRIARRNAPFQPIWILPVADGAGAASVGTLTITAPGVSGPAVLSVLGRRIVVQVNAADTATIIAAAVRDAINAAGLTVSATAAVGVVTATHRHLGAIGNGLELRVRSEEPNVFTTTNAVVVAIGTSVAGTGVPTLTTALANMGDDEFDWIASPYSDTTSLNAIRDLLSDSGLGRWSPMKQLYGHYITATIGANLAAVVAIGNARNDRHVTIIGSQALPTPIYELAAALGGMASAHLTSAPELSRPLQSLELIGVIPPVSRALWWTITDRQALYADGVAGYRVTNDGLVIVDRIVTTEQVNISGVPDTTFLDIETLAQMMFVVRSFKSEIVNKFARMALAADNPSNVDTIATPRDVRAALIHAYQRLVDVGVLENKAAFAQLLEVEINLLDPNRVDAFLPADVVNQFRVFAANITTFLQINDVGDVIAVAA